MGAGSSRPARRRKVEQTRQVRRRGKPNRSTVERRSRADKRGPFTASTGRGRGEPRPEQLNDGDDLGRATTVELDFLQVERFETTNTRRSRRTRTTLVLVVQDLRTFVAWWLRVWRKKNSGNGEVADRGRAPRPPSAPRSAARRDIMISARTSTGDGKTTADIPVGVTVYADRTYTSSRRERRSRSVDRWRLAKGRRADRNKVGTVTPSGRGIAKTKMPDINCRSRGGGQDGKGRRDDDRRRRIRLSPGR